MTNYYFPIIYIVPLISIDGQASPRLFIAPEIRHEKISYTYTAISQRSYSNAENIINLYKKSTKYKISKICDAAVSENRQRDRKRSL